MRKSKVVNTRYAAAVLAMAAFAFCAMSSGSFAHDPPKDLKKVGDHWTAWDPPQDLASDVEIHVIQSGDTLWDLSERFLGNAYLWPQLWERNSYILDAHWIYPGDPLVLGINVEPQDALEMTAVEQPGFEAVDESFRYEDPYGRIQQLGSGDDIYCSGYIGELDETFPLRVEHSEYDFLGPRMRTSAGTSVGKYGIVGSIQVNLAVGDIVYLDGGRASGLSPGDIFTAIEPGPIVRDPGGAGYGAAGRLYNYQGRVRVLSVQEETAIAEVSYSCEQMTVGSGLTPFVREPVPTERRSPMRPVNYPAAKESLKEASRVLYAKDGILSIGQDHVVFVELPGQDVIPGDVFTVYRVTDAAEFPIVIGEVAILSVHPKSAVAKVIESRYPIYVGDVLDAK